MLGHSLSIIISNLQVAFTTAFVLTAAPACAHNHPGCSTFYEAKNAVEGRHRTSTALAELSDNPQDKLAADLG
jgi:hypothetical protein